MQHARHTLDAEALLLDPEEVAMRALALGNATNSAEAGLLTAQRQLMKSQRRAALALELGLPVVPMIEEAITSVGSIAEALGLPPERALVASVRFNDLPEVIRHAFFILKETRRVPTLDELRPWLQERDGGQTPMEPDTIQAWLLTSVQALFDTREPSA
jgi:hypothetical protein